MATAARQLGLVVVTAAVSAHLLIAQNGDSAALFPIFEDGLLGYIDEHGTVVIPPQFERVYPSPVDVDLIQFSEGRAGALRNGKWGFIDTGGKWIAEPQFESITSFSQRRRSMVS